MTRHPGWEIFVDFLLYYPASQVAWQQSIVRGGSKSYEDYREMVGKIAGVQFAIEGPSRIARQFKDAVEKKERGVE